MSAEENKAIIRHWYEVLNTQNSAAVPDIVTADFVRHDPNAPELRGPEAEQQLMAKNFGAFPDLHITIDDLVAEGDRVVARLTARGTHQGKLRGIPPTNRQVTIAAIEIYRLVDGKIAEQWVVADALGMLQQLGAIPTPGQAQQAGA